MGKASQTEVGAKRMAQESRWEVDSDEMEWRAVRSQLLADGLSWNGQNQSRPRRRGWRERKEAQVGWQGAVLEKVWARSSVEADAMVAEGNMVDRVR